MIHKVHSGFFNKTVIFRTYYFLQQTFICSTILGYILASSSLFKHQISNFMIIDAIRNIY